MFAAVVLYPRLTVAPERRTVPWLMVTLPVNVLLPPTIKVPSPDLVREPVVLPITELMVKAFAGVDPLVMMTVSTAATPSWLPVIVAVPAELSKRTPLAVRVRIPPRVMVGADTPPTIFRVLMEAAPVVAALTLWE